MPAAVSPESMIALVPSYMAFATSVASALVGLGCIIMESSICVAVMTCLHEKDNYLKTAELSTEPCDSIKTPMEFDRCSHAIFHFFSKYQKTFNHKNKKIQADGCMLNIIVFQFL